MAVPRRRTKTGRPRRFRLGVRFLLICGAIIGFIVYLPIFVLRDLYVEGNVYLTKEDLRQIAGVYYGEPLYKLETDSVTKKLMNDLRIEEASVRRSFPDGLSITIRERTPVATVACDYGYLDLDRQGKVIDCYKTLKNMPIPMVTGIKLRDMYIGDDNKDATLTQIIYFLQLLNQESLNQISEVALVSADYFVAYTTQSVQIRLGKLERLEEKARLTDVFLRDLQQNPLPVEYVDFNYKAPFLKLTQ